MTGGAPAADAFPGQSGLPWARRTHWGRWLSAAALLLLLLALGRAFARGQIEWPYVARFLTAPAILDGMVNTVVMAVLAMALGIVLGVAAAIARLSPNPVLKGAAAFYVWLFRGTPLILQLLLWFNLALVFPTIGIPGVWSGRAVDLMTPFAAALLGLGINQGAYTSGWCVPACCRWTRGNTRRRRRSAWGGCGPCAGSSCRRRCAWCCRRLATSSSAW